VRSEVNFLIVLVVPSAGNITESLDVEAGASSCHRSNGLLCHEIHVELSKGSLDLRKEEGSLGK